MKILMAAEDFPSSPSSLPEHEVHLWRLKLEQPEQHVDEFISILSREEQRRAAKFRFERDRNRFVVARGVLKTILASYLNNEPDQLELSYGAYGKPYVPHRSYEIQFSLAHSHEVVLYAFARERNVGVDVEQIRELPDVEQMATTYLTEQENAVFKSLPRGRKSRAFFESWTRKEAYLKAIGTGLAQPFTRINPSVTFGWSITSFTLDPDYVAALAIEGHDSFSVSGTDSNIGGIDSGQIRTVETTESVHCERSNLQPRSSCIDLIRIQKSDEVFLQHDGR